MIADDIAPATPEEDEAWAFKEMLQRLADDLRAGRLGLPMSYSPTDRMKRAVGATVAIANPHHGRIYPSAVHINPVGSKPREDD